LRFPIELLCSLEITALRFIAESRRRLNRAVWATVVCSRFLRALSFLPVSAAIPLAGFPLGRAIFRWHGRDIGAVDFAVDVLNPTSASLQSLALQVGRLALSMNASALSSSETM
jgi:hypothetical protein